VGLEAIWLFGPASRPRGAIHTYFTADDGPICLGEVAGLDAVSFGNGLDAVSNFSQLFGLTNNSSPDLPQHKTKWQLLQTIWWIECEPFEARPGLILGHVSPVPFASADGNEWVELMASVHKDPDLEGKRLQTLAAQGHRSEQYKLQAHKLSWVAQGDGAPRGAASVHPAWLLRRAGRGDLARAGRGRWLAWRRAGASQHDTLCGCSLYHKDCIHVQVWPHMCKAWPRVSRAGVAFSLVGKSVVGITFLWREPMSALLRTPLYIPA